MGGVASHPLEAAKDGDANSADGISEAGLRGGCPLRLLAVLGERHFHRRLIGPSTETVCA